MTLENTVYKYKKELQNLGYCKNSVDNYPKYVQYLLDYTKEIPQKITDTQIKNYHQYLKTKPKRNKKELISQSHICTQILAIKLYFNYLQRTKTIKKNPCTLKIKQNPSNERTVLTQQEIQQLYKSCTNTTEKTILNLCYGCGLRKTEAALLTIKDVNLDQKLLFVRKGKGKKRRVVPLTQAIVKDLTNHLISIEPTRNKNQESFLINSNGNNIKSENIYSIFKKLLKKTQSLKPENYTLHSLRHSIATHLLENQMSIEMVRDFLGHENLKTTQIYTRVTHLNLKQ
jgi:integrase/recombinase XerD